MRASFGQRRKTLINSLAGAGFQREKVLAALEVAKFSSTLRAENLSIEDFANLANALF